MTIVILLGAWHGLSAALFRPHGHTNHETVAPTSARSLEDRLRHIRQRSYKYARFVIECSV